MCAKFGVAAAQVLQRLRAGGSTSLHAEGSCHGTFAAPFCKVCGMRYTTDLMGTTLQVALANGLPPPSLRLLRWGIMNRSTTV